MWTSEQNETYSKHLDRSRKNAKNLGKKIAKMVAPKIQKDTRKKDDSPNCRGINSIFVPHIIEPLVSILDDSYDTLGQANFKWMIDLYVGRKCKKIIPLLLEIAKRLNDGKHTVTNKKECGWSDGYMWNASYSKDRISMQWDTQSRSYYIELRKPYSSSKCWKLYVAEYKYGDKQVAAKESWEKEPGYVLSFEESDFSNLGEEYENDEKVENAWLYLPQISRFFDMVNPACTSMNFNLYKKPFKQ